MINLSCTPRSAPPLRGLRPLPARSLRDPRPTRHTPNRSALRAPCSRQPIQAAQSRFCKNRRPVRNLGRVANPAGIAASGVAAGEAGRRAITRSARLPHTRRRVSGAMALCVASGVTLFQTSTRPSTYEFFHPVSARSAPAPGALSRTVQIRKALRAGGVMRGRLPADPCGARRRPGAVSTVAGSTRGAGRQTVRASPEAP